MTEFINCLQTSSIRKEISKTLMELSIIITSYKNPQLLKVCLDSVKNSIKAIEYEIIVADSQTQEDTEMMMREDYPGVIFFAFRENVGFQALVRKGIENSKGKYILLVNGDIIVTPNSIQKLLKYLKENPEVGMVGPKLLNFNGTLQDSCFRFYRLMTIVYRRTFLGKFPFAKKHIDWFLMKDYDHKDPKEVDWLMGGALFISRKALDEVGLMDTRYFMYMEDVDWCRRFWDKQYKVVYYPLVSMHHYHGKGSNKGGVLRSLLFSKYSWIHISSAIKYFIKFWGKPVPKHN